MNCAWPGVVRTERLCHARSWCGAAIERESCLMSVGCRQSVCLAGRLGTCGSVRPGSRHIPLQVGAVVFPAGRPVYGSRPAAVCSGSALKRLGMRGACATGPSGGGVPCCWRPGGTAVQRGPVSGGHTGARLVCRVPITRVTVIVLSPVSDSRSTPMCRSGRYTDLRRPTCVRARNIRPGRRFSGYESRAVRRVGLGRLPVIACGGSR